MHYLSIFSKDLIKHELIFRAFGGTKQGVRKFWKNFDENSIAKLNLLFIILIFWKILLLKLEPSDIAPFPTAFFPFRCEDFPISPGYAIGDLCRFISKLSKSFGAVAQCYPLYYARNGLAKILNKTAVKFEKTLLLYLKHCQNY